MSEKELSDPVIDEIRAVRSRISAQFDHDPKKLVEHYMELQKRHADRLIGRPEGSAPVSEVMEQSEPNATTRTVPSGY
jgi:hypothetical protein